MGASVIAVSELSKTPRAWCHRSPMVSMSSGAGRIVLQFRTRRQEKTLETECRVLTASPTMALIPAPLRPPYRADFGASSRRP